MRQTKLIVYSVICAVLFVACDRGVEQRHYTEVVINSPVSRGAAEMNAPNILRQNMPQDDVHAGLDFNNMPDDEIHAGLKPGNMPQDDIHANLNSGNIPDDDIHANLKSGGSQMGMTMQPGIAESADRSPLTWKTPQGWTETKGSGIRMVTFTAADKNTPFETSIVSLGGSAGGFSSNVARWMTQLNMSVPGERELQEFINKQEHFSTDSGLPVVFIDFSQLQGSDGEDVPSMVAAVIDRGQAQIFVKMTGSKKAVQKNRDRMKALVRSITPGG